jgi:[acyl-carrier-protein] S-malonyltransferase
MSKKIAFLFPGQGSQALGMLAAFAPQYPIVQETFAEASAALSFDLWQVCQQGPVEKLNQTEVTQPALLAASAALWRLWRKEGGEFPQFMAGHSLGEYSALVCAEALSFPTAIQLVAERGRLMQEAVPEGAGAMAAIVGLENSELLALCETLCDGQVLAPANYNSIGQTVVAGHREAVTRLVAAAKQAGAKLAKLIPVSVPSHCALMEPAAEHLKHYLNTIPFVSPKVAIINNVDVKIEDNVTAIKNALIRQLVSPVRWVEIIQRLEQEQVELFIECGSGKVLTGLNKRITSLPSLSIGDPETFQRALIA